jgi:hypothetical protein
MPSGFTLSTSTVSDAPINAGARLALAKVIHERLGSNSIPGAIDGVCEDLLWKIINTPVHVKRIDSDGFTYDGEFLMGKRHGMGKSTHWSPNELTYEGQWENDVRCGKGKESNSYGYSYVGDFLNDAMNGRGKVIYPGGEKTYVGEYKDGYQHGYGEHNSTAAYIPGRGQVRSYKGYWKFGDYEGKGIKVYANGRIYEGDFVRGIEKGQGKEIYPDGRIYEGSMSSIPYGSGKWTYSSGETVEGMWYDTALYDVDNIEDLPGYFTEDVDIDTDDESDTGSETDDGL